MIIGRATITIVLSVGLLGSGCAPEEAIVEIAQVDATMIGGYRSDPARSGEVTG